MYKLDFNIISLITKTILRSKIGKYYDPNFYKHSKKYTLDQIITDLILFLKRGTSWRDHCGTVCWNTLFMHYQRFTKENIFKKCYDIIINKYSTQNKSQCIIVDSSFIGNKNGRNKYFKNKNCNKLSILCDENGFPFSIIIKEGNINDAKLFISHKRHLHRINKNKTQKYVLADAGYDSSKVKKIITDNKLIPIISQNKRNTKDKSKIIKLNKEHKKIYKKRIKVENVFCILKKTKRIQNRYDSYLSSYLGFLYLLLIVRVCK